MGRKPKLPPVNRQRLSWDGVAKLAVVATLTTMVALVVAPWWQHLHRYGFHDWDVISSFRYLTITTLRDGEFPGFNPYACGGYPLWGYVEGATNLVSPWLPAYWFLPLPVALRVEVTGMALLAAAGAYVMARTLSPSRSAALLVAALWAVNGRFGLQLAAGHAWHLSYALLPWSLYFFERWRKPGAKLRYLVGLSCAMAWMLYAGGIYPLPHAALALGTYACLHSVAQRCLRPLWSLALAALFAVGLSAPKLLPMLHTLAADPRLIESTETLHPAALFTLLTHPIQSFASRPAAVTPYGWHEWGMYISLPGLMVVALGLLRVSTRREKLLALVGGGLLLLGMGAFHPLAPWPWLHRHVPIFRSQHVPSRWLYPALLLLALAALGAWATTFERLLRSRPWLDVVAIAAVAWLALDIASVAQQPMRESMWMEPPRLTRAAVFHHQQQPPYQYRKRDWAAPMLLSMMANTGVLQCYGVPQQPHRPPAPLPPTAADYRGEVYVLGGGRARLLRRTNNRIDVQVTDAAVTSRVVVNLRYWLGWSVDSAGGHRPAQGYQRLLSAPAHNGVMSFRYTPPGLLEGCAWSGLSWLALLLFRWRSVMLSWLRRRKRGAEITTDSGSAEPVGH